MGEFQWVDPMENEELDVSNERQCGSLRCLRFCQNKADFKEQMLHTPLQAGTRTFPEAVAEDETKFLHAKLTKSTSTSRFPIQLEK